MERFIGKPNEALCSLALSVTQKVHSIAYLSCLTASNTDKENLFLKNQKSLKMKNYHKW